VAEDRFVVFPDTTIGNPNDLALMLVITSICLVSLFFSSSKLLRLIPLVSLPPAMYFILKTGSRANFLTILLLVLCTLFVAPRRIKSIMILGAPVVIAVLVLILPSSTLNRLTLIVADPLQTMRENSEAEHAAASQFARTELQKEAVQLTLHHPLLGVGPGQFAEAVDAMVRADTGHKSGWQNAHNVYLQIAAENGVVAALVYIWVMLWAIKINYQIYKAKNVVFQAYHPQSFCLLLVTVAFAFGQLFGNYMYQPMFPLLIGLTAGNYLALQRELRLRTPQAVVGDRVHA
jgi:O-antigen ligase